MTKVSVIIPVYNVEKYLQRCFDSVVNQTLKEIEIILVNDGSSDSSGEICDRLEKTDSRVRVIHKQNGGLSDARNAGIEAAQGEFLSFIDSDDYVVPDMLEYLYINAVNSGAQIATGTMIMVKNGNAKTSSDFTPSVFSPEKALENALYGPVSSLSVCNKIFKKELFEDIKFLVGKTYEDAYIVPSLFLKADKIFMSGKAVYHYVIDRQDSITNVSFSEKNFNMVDAFEFNRKKVCEKYPALFNVFTYRIYYAYVMLFKKIIFSVDFKKNKYYNVLVAKIRSGKKFVLKSKYFDNKFKFLYILLCLSPVLYAKIMRRHMNG